MNVLATRREMDASSGMPFEEGRRQKNALSSPPRTTRRASCRRALLHDRGFPPPGMQCRVVAAFGHHGCHVNAVGELDQVSPLALPEFSPKQVACGHRCTKNEDRSQGGVIEKTILEQRVRPPNASNRQHHKPNAQPNEPSIHPAWHWRLRYSMDLQPSGGASNRTPSLRFPGPLDSRRPTHIRHWPSSNLSTTAFHRCCNRVTWTALVSRSVALVAFLCRVSACVGPSSVCCVGGSPFSSLLSGISHVPRL